MQIGNKIHPTQEGLLAEHKTIETPEIVVKKIDDPNIKFNFNLEINYCKIHYDLPLLNQPQLLEILKLTTKTSKKDSIELFVGSEKNTNFQDSINENMKINFNHYSDYQNAYEKSQISSDNLLSTILLTRQILEYIPFITEVSKLIANHIDYNITLPEISENKVFLVTTHLILGNAVIIFLPEEAKMNAIFVSAASTTSYAVRLIIADYLQHQGLATSSAELAQQCGMTIAAYSLPGAMNYVVTKAMLPNAEVSITGIDMLGSSSLGVTQCYNNYKVVYASSESEQTTANIVAPYIADAVVLWNLRGYMNFDASNTATLMLSVKNAMSVVVTTYAGHCMGSMSMDLVPQEVKEAYIDPVFDYVYETAAYGVESIKQISGDIVCHFVLSDEL